MSLLGVAQQEKQNKKVLSCSGFGKVNSPVVFSLQVKLNLVWLLQAQTRSCIYKCVRDSVLY